LKREQRQPVFFETTVFQILILLLLSSGLILMVMVLSGFFLTRYLFNVVHYFEAISVFNVLVLMGFLIYERLKQLRWHANYVLLHATFWICLLSAFLVFFFSEA